MDGPTKAQGADPTAPSGTNEHPVVVVGAGFAGLAAAVRLAREGRRVIVVEATTGGGGRSRSFHHRPTG
ncbi:MAG: FAD-dependent oxidoreductase, partial [Deltaproteobacteria bacterium]|nr:FAD-dependent oxidoreductase [Deltaproteobacteria bacterium]